MKKTSKALALAASLALVATGLVGCQKNDDSAAKDTASQSASETPQETKSDDSKMDKKDDGGEEEAVGAVKANSRPEECGLQEQAGPEGTWGPFNGAIHYFQPGEMMDNPNAKMKMRKYADSQMHLELDFKANEYATNWGYSVDETPANLPIVYKLTDSSDKVLAHGMMTPMNAIDGSHYGTNLPKDTITAPGEYKMTITVYPPQGYDFHNDYITGVPARSVWKPLTVTMPWKITQENLDIVKNNTVANPMEVPEKCKDYPVKMFEDATAEKAMKEAEAATPLPMMDHM